MLVVILCHELASRREAGCLVSAHVGGDFVERLCVGWLTMPNAIIGLDRY